MHSDNVVEGFIGVHAGRFWYLFEDPRLVFFDKI